MLGEWMQNEIEAQPRLLAEAAQRYPSELAAQGEPPCVELILLAARGSSDHAALYARYLFEVHLGVPVVLAAPAVLTRYHAEVRYPRCLAIGISQSGAAPDVAEVIGALSAAGHETLAITNTAGSRLTAAASRTLLLGVGDERSIAASKTYAATLLALYEVARFLGASLPPSATPSESWLGLTREIAQGHARAVVDAKPVFSLGRGYSFASASETALKLMECALVPCKAYSTADFEHGPKALATEGSLIIDFEPDSQGLARQGARIVRPPAAMSPSEELAPLWQAVYAQWLALECARLVGEDPDEAQFLKKVTRTL